MEKRKNKELAMEGVFNKEAKEFTYLEYHLTNNRSKGMKWNEEKV